MNKFNVLFDFLNCAISKNTIKQFFLLFGNSDHSMCTGTHVTTKKKAILHVNSPLTDEIIITWGAFYR